MKTNKQKKARKTPLNIAEVMGTWRSLMGQITEMTENELRQALQSELTKPLADRREDVIVRLHRKYTRMRQERELREYLGEPDQNHADR